MKPQDLTDWENVEDRPGTLEYKPTAKSRKWREAVYRPRVVRSIAENDGHALARQQGWHAFRYVAR